MMLGIFIYMRKMLALKSTILLHFKINVKVNHEVA